jgi:shikimate kinase
MNFDLNENNNKNIVLVGMMGAGKTYIATKLSKLLVHFSYVDIDSEIEKETNLTVSEIFEKNSEDYFRALEVQTIKKFSLGKNQIISIGGGAFENSKNQYALKENSLVFYLRASARELFNRIENEKGSVHRPLLANDFSVKTIQDILKKREKNYKKAHFTIETDQKPGYTILDEILKECDTYAK